MGTLERSQRRRHDKWTRRRELCSGRLLRNTITLIVAAALVAMRTAPQISFQQNSAHAPADSARRCSDGTLASACTDFFAIAPSDIQAFTTVGNDAEKEYAVLQCSGDMFDPTTPSKGH